MAETILRSGDWSGSLVAKSGIRFFVRPVEPGDVTALAEFYRRLSLEDLRYRFLTAVREVGEARLIEMTAVDHDRTENFLAFWGEADMLVGSAMLVADEARERAEVAIAIRSDVKRRGIGARLLMHVADYAEARRIRILESISSADNWALIELERRLGFTCRPLADDASLVHLQRRLR
ncbi:GNAT family N-acetyltransferase [Sphingosinicella sp. BN140058]|uniref:GNAT family N-acetyltransferase n=1 Tax=Sphingosinicella sp. BN140058 TaxID=1892855 RepID=UPI00101083AC|nr:GNAT family N-acetyltransferase [Sphingosinicella sp. BN140058]QAY78359.1 GNAT family N-acetyltransferase [Sphingosinicella sp. BN140058]